MMIGQAENTDQGPGERVSWVAEMGRREVMIDAPHEGLVKGEILMVYRIGLQCGDTVQMFAKAQTPRVRDVMVCPGVIAGTCARQHP